MRRDRDTFQSEIYTLFAWRPTKFLVNTANHVDVSRPACLVLACGRPWSLPRVARSCHIQKPASPCQRGAVILDDIRRRSYGGWYLSASQALELGLVAGSV